MMNLPAYDELHVISDLHMGGAPGFQILGETARLAAFVRWVRGQRPDGQVALLLNGDVVDTLAEDIQGYLAIETAVATVERIIDRDPAFSPIWDALAEFVRTKNRTLVIVIGNHDLEVALPPVQRHGAGSSSRPSAPATRAWSAVSACSARTATRWTPGTTSATRTWPASPAG